MEKKSLILRITMIVHSAGYYAAAILLCGLAAEGTGRLVHWNARPMIPYVLDRTGVARMAPSINFPVKMPGYQRIQLTTDDLGCRVADTGTPMPNHGGGVLFVGDSQILGWGLRFEETMAARTAAHLGVASERTWILAAGAQEPSSIRAWAEDYTHRHPERHRLIVVGLNLGNDLEEIHFGVASRSSRVAFFTDWLATHSILYLDWALLKQHLTGLEKDDSFPGVNAAMVATGVDRPQLARRVVNALIQLLHALPEAEQVAVVVIPQDSQVAFGEFEKYRYGYSTDAEFLRYRDLQRIAVKRLGETSDRIVAELRMHGVTAVNLAPVLMTQAGPELFDRISHHLLAPAQELASQALMRALGQSQ